jgi:hypothetical protein
MNMSGLAVAAAGVMALGVGTVQAQSGFGPWHRYTYQDGVFVEYAVKRESEGLRIAWRCRNMNSYSISCSVGAGQNKRYHCRAGSTRLGETGALGERATVREGGTYTFPSESACRGTGASSLNADVRISIER